MIELQYKEDQAVFGIVLYDSMLHYTRIKKITPEHLSGITGLFGVFPFRLLPFRLLPFCLFPFRLLPFRLLSNVTSVPFRLHSRFLYIAIFYGNSNKTIYALL